MKLNQKSRITTLHQITILIFAFLLFNVSLALADETTANQTAPNQKSSTEPTLFKAKYKAYRNGSDVGEATMALTKQGNHFQLFYQSDLSIFFFSDKRTETSLFKIVNNQYIPMEYHYTREGTGPDKQLNLRFDSESQQIFKEKGDPINWQSEWDNQLYRFDLQNRIKNKDSDISYRLINYRGELKSYGFEIVGEEMLDLPYGKINTIKVRTIRASKKRETFSWFAPDLNYQLVRLQQFKKGKEQGDIQLSEYTPEN